MPNPKYEERCAALDGPDLVPESECGQFSDAWDGTKELHDGVIDTCTCDVDLQTSDACADLGECRSEILGKCRRDGTLGR